MKYIITFICCTFFFLGFSQKNVNDYKYAIVPKQFDFQKTPDQYRLNQLTKFLLKKYGFDAYVENEELPEDLQENNCLALKAIVQSSGTFKTKTKVKLLDCFNNVIFTTDEAITKEKDYNKAYNLTIREAFNDVANLNYKFVPKDRDAKQRETKASAQHKESNKSNDKTPKKEVIQKVTESKTTTVLVAPEKTDENSLNSFDKFTRNNQIFYLKPGYGGMYLVDKNNETIFKLQDTSKNHVYIVTIDNLTGVAFFNKEERFYTLEYFKNNERKIEIYKYAQ